MSKPSLGLLPSADVVVKVDAGVCIITLNRVEKKNAINVAMYAAMADAITAAAGAPDIRVVLFLGHEEIFCAGNDLGDFLAPPATGIDPPAFRFLRELSCFPKPLVAAVCGRAVGIGATMLLHIDLICAGENAEFSMPFVGLGLCAEAGSSLLAPQLFGHQRASALLLAGDSLTAQEALQIGLVSKVVPACEAASYALGLARKVSAKPLSAVMETKRLMKRAQQAALLEQMAEEERSIRRMLLEPAAREAIASFAERRKPDLGRM